MKTTKLEVDYDYNFWLLGVTSSVKFYKLAWAINNKLNIQLVRSQDHSLVSKVSRTIHFGLYRYITEHGEIELFKNRGLDDHAQHILPEFEHFDFFVKISGSLQSFTKEEIIKELRDVKWIEYIAALEIDNLKSKDNFLS